MKSTSLRAILLFFISTFYTVDSSDVMQPFASRMLFMMLDTSEILTDFFDRSGFGALSESLLIALDQKVPLIVTPSLMRNIILARTAFYDFATQPLETLEKKYKDSGLLTTSIPFAEYKQYISYLYETLHWSQNTLNEIIKNLRMPKSLTIKPEQWYSTRLFMRWNTATTKPSNQNLDKQKLDALNYMLRAYIMQYNPNEWINKQINETLVLLIPKEAFRDIQSELNSYAIKQAITNSAISPLEQKLGLKIDHMDPIDPQEMINPGYYKPLTKIDFKPQNIFVTKREYNNENHIQTWGFYLQAHGAKPFPLQAEIDKICNILAPFLGYPIHCEKLTLDLARKSAQAIELFRKIYYIDLAKLQQRLDPWFWLSQSASLTKQTIQLIQEIDSLQTQLAQNPIKLDLYAQLLAINHQAFLNTTKSLSNPMVAANTWIREFINTLNALVPYINSFLLPLASNPHLIEQLEYLVMLKKSGISYLSQFGDLKTPELKNFLEFCDTQLITRVMFLNACYIGGEIFKILAKTGYVVGHSYTYPLIALGLVDSPTLFLYRNLTPYILISEQIKNNIIVNKHDIYLDNLFKEITTPQTYWPSISQLIKQLGTQKEIANFAQVKLPGVEWTQLVRISNLTVSITPLLAKTHTGALDISQFFGGKKTIRDPLSKGLHTIASPIYPQVLLLYTHLVPFALKITKNPLDAKALPPAIISMISGNALHKIAEIDAADFTLDEVIRSFFKVRKIEPHKIFFIEKIITKDYPHGAKNVTVFNRVPLTLLLNDKNFMNGFALAETPTQGREVVWPADQNPPDVFVYTFNVTPHARLQQLEQFAKQNNFFIPQEITPSPEDVIRFGVQHKEPFEAMLGKREHIRLDYSLNTLAQSLGVLAASFK